MTSAYLGSFDGDRPYDGAVTASVAIARDGPPAEPAVAVEEAILYLRVSSKKQMDTDADYDPEGNSIPTQRRIGQGKADNMGVPVVREYVEPGRSATSLDKRVAFQQMMADLPTLPNVKYVIVYMMSRAFRNALEELTTKAQLAKMGITLISAKENFGDGYLGDAMQGILAIFNELQVRMSGDDIRTKMANKARNGGTVSRAPIGYLNVAKRVEGREIRTVIIDPERGPLIRLAFELYATGDYTLDDLSEELYDRGLRTRPTAGRPAQAISVSRLSDLLRDRYYVGVITFQGDEIAGRHEPLVSEELFEQVQDVIEMRTAAKEYRRVHHHYLKGSLFCGACHAGGLTQRMIMQETTNRHGTTYLYFVCQGRKKEGTCDTPHINVARLEDAVEEHYARIRFAPAFMAEVRSYLAEAIGESEASARLLHQQLTSELTALDAKEENLLDLAADGEMPQGRIKLKLREIEARRRKLQSRLSDTSTELSNAARLIDLALTLLENPQALYLRSNDTQRRLLNQAIFHALYVEEDKITGHTLKEPFASLKAIEAARQKEIAEEAPQAASRGAAGLTRFVEDAGDEDGADSRQGVHTPQNTNRALPLAGKGSTWVSTLQDLLLGTGSVPGCSGSSMVGDTGFEPVASSV